jgi:hypothetical protein
MMQIVSSRLWPSVISVLESLVVRFQGHANNWLAQRAAAQAVATLDNLLVEASSLWQIQNFRRYSDDEVCCTVCFFDCCEAAIASNPNLFSPLRVVYDGAQPTRAMRAGSAHPASAPRPDLTVLFGQQVTIRVEAKRLALSSGLPGKYVRQGMRRFLDGRYSSTAGKPGIMLGFVTIDAPDNVIDAINKAIRSEPDLTDSDCLMDATAPIPAMRRCESHHSDGLMLLHCAIDLR